MLEHIRTKPHDLRDIFRAAGLSTADVARFLGLSLGRAQQILSGRDKATARVEEKLRELARLCNEDETER